MRHQYCERQHKWGSLLPNRGEALNDTLDIRDNLDTATARSVYIQSFDVPRSAVVRVPLPGFLARVKIELKKLDETSMSLGLILLYKKKSQSLVLVVTDLYS